MHNKLKFLFATLVISSLSFIVNAGPDQSKCEHNWIAKGDRAFAADCADMAFSKSLKNREKFAWMAFTRANQLIEDSHGVSNSGKVPLWMAWPTDDDTFAVNPDFKFTRTNRDDIVPVTSKKVLAGNISLTEPDSANEEVTRNAVGYNYITKKAKLNTKKGVLKYINDGNQVNMPVGSIEIKASWLKVPPGGAPKGALTFEFESGTYWWRGLHVMVKMRSLAKDENLFYTEKSSWFWTTFEFNNNPGVNHVRQELITQRAPLSAKEITSILSEGGIEGFGFEAYAPNGTQTRFTVNGNGKKPVILGHTDMEDFAGAPNTAQPSYWTSFNASCHSCHATAAIDPKTATYFPFSVPTGALSPQYYGVTSSGANLYLGDGFVPLDFMWPIVFHAK
jgi:hypothetical protein